MRASPPSMFLGRETPSQKTLEDRFKAVLNKRPEAVKNNMASSGIAEEYGEKEILADDIIMEVDEKLEQDKAEKNERTEREEVLVRAGEAIRNRARNRALRRIPRSDEEAGSSSDTPVSTSNASVRRRPDENGETTDEVLMEDIKKRRLNDDKRLAIEKERFVLGERSCLAEKRFAETQETNRRRLDLDEKRAALEMEERKQAMEERKKMIDVLGTLANKLS